MVLLALVAAGAAFALSQRGAGSSSPPRPPLFPTRFGEAGFLAGEARLVSSYDAAAGDRRLSRTVDVRGTVYLVVRCGAGTVHIVVGGATSARTCTGAAEGVVALYLGADTQLTATVSSVQRGRWGVAIYR
jgi:hypothetical protein